MSPLFGRRAAAKEAEVAATVERRAREQAAWDEQSAAAAERLASAAVELLDATSTWLGSRFVASVHLPWPTARPHTPAPATAVLAGVLQRLGEQPPVSLVDAYVAADAERCATKGSVRVSPEELARFTTDLPAPQEVPEWLAGFTCPAHDRARDALIRISADLEAAGAGRLPVDEALSSPRWWPGRREGSGGVVGDPLGRVGTFRSLEERGDVGDWRGPWNEASELAVRGGGLPPFDPEDWVLAAFRHASVDRGGLGLR